MYNRYIPEESRYTPVDPQERRAHHAGEKLGLPLKELLKKLSVDKLDSGDILLLLIVLLLWKDSEDTDLLLALGAAMLMGGEGK